MKDLIMTPQEAFEYTILQTYRNLHILREESRSRMGMCAHHCMPWGVFSEEQEALAHYLRNTFIRDGLHAVYPFNSLKGDYLVEIQNRSMLKNKERIAFVLRHIDQALENL